MFVGAVCAFFIADLAFSPFTWSLVVDTNNCAEGYPVSPKKSSIWSLMEKWVRLKNRGKSSVPERLVSRA